MRTFGAALLATTLIVTSAFAAPLAPGKPAGVNKAQMEGNTTLILVGVGLVGLGIGLAASSQGASGPSSISSAPITTGGAI